MFSWFWLQIIIWHIRYFLVRTNPCCFYNTQQSTMIYVCYLTSCSFLCYLNYYLIKKSKYLIITKNIKIKTTPTFHFFLWADFLFLNKYRYNEKCNNIIFTTKVNSKNGINSYSISISYQEFIFFIILSKS